LKIEEQQLFKATVDRQRQQYEEGIKESASSTMIDGVPAALGLETNNSGGESYDKTTTFLRGNYLFQIESNWGIDIFVIAADTSITIPFSFQADKQTVTAKQNQVLDSFNFLAS
jgi:hypothetical protein